MRECKLAILSVGPTITREEGSGRRPLTAYTPPSTRFLFFLFYIFQRVTRLPRPSPLHWTLIFLAGFGQEGMPGPESPPHMTKLRQKKNQGPMSGMWKGCGSRATLSAGKGNRRGSKGDRIFAGVHAIKAPPRTRRGVGTTLTHPQNQGSFPGIP